jgi:exo-beta-1,3-glucanase (GH17 family)
MKIQCTVVYDFNDSDVIDYNEIIRTCVADYNVSSCIISEVVNTSYVINTVDLDEVVDAIDLLGDDDWNSWDTQTRYEKTYEVVHQWIGKLTEAQLDELEDLNMHTAYEILRGGGKCM